ncbi:MAG TPA: hypothetical protein VHP56_13265 [Solirubrobacterales bacterium]|jgi:hypothetical protein|nr:hypothetical protein [Solirubrobacterales bacterium]
MNDTEYRDLARQLSEGSDVLDFETALEIVQWRPDKAREILRMRAETQRQNEEMDRGRERRRRALIEDYG